MKMIRNKVNKMLFDQGLGSSEIDYNLNKDNIIDVKRPLNIWKVSGAGICIIANISATRGDHHDRYF